MSYTDQKSSGNPIQLPSLHPNICVVDGVLQVPSKEGGLEERIAWIRDFAQSGDRFTIELNEDVNFKAQFLRAPGKKDITITLIGIGEMRTIELIGNGSIFTIDSGFTLVLSNNVTLKGSRKNNAPLILVNGGRLSMGSNSRIIGNHGGGVCLTSTHSLSTPKPIFRPGNSNIFKSMSELETNVATFNMNGGEISGNNGNHGGGVFVGAESVFNMSGGTITNNRARRAGGVWNEGTFRIKNGCIKDNISRHGHPNIGGIKAVLTRNFD